MNADARREAGAFLRHLFENVPGLVEMRCFHPSKDRGLIRRAFFESWRDPTLLDFAFTIASTHDVYVGIATRGERRGDKAACTWVPALWTEIDFAGHPFPPDLLERLDSHRRPTMLVHSGGGVHAYFKLKLPVFAQPPEPIEGRLRALTRAVGGDPAAVDLPRVLRLAGTFNHKPERIAKYGGPVPVRLLRVAA